MAFTDDNLKQLKKDINMAPVDAEIHVQKCSAFLARLEAGDQCGYSLNNLVDTGIISEDSIAGIRAKIWRKAAGK